MLPSEEGIERGSDEKAVIVRPAAKRWNEEEEAVLLSLVEEVGLFSWSIVAERLGTQRTPSAVEQHWQILTGRRKRRRLITNSFFSPLEQDHNRHINFEMNDSKNYQVQFQSPDSNTLGQEHFATSAFHHSIPLPAPLPPTPHNFSLYTNSASQAGSRQRLSMHHTTTFMHTSPQANSSTTTNPRHENQYNNRPLNNRWTTEEEHRLRSLIEELGKGKWTAIAEALGTRRSASAVEQHWQIMIGQRKRNSSSAKTKSIHTRHPTSTTPNVFTCPTSSAPLGVNHIVRHINLPISPPTLPGINDHQLPHAEASSRISPNVNNLGLTDYIHFTPIDHVANCTTGQFIASLDSPATITTTSDIGASPFHPFHQSQRMIDSFTNDTPGQSAGSTIPYSIF